MSWKNETSVKEFWLLGFQNAHNLKIPLFILFLAIYISILFGNLLIIVLVLGSRNLNAPMYVFLSNLSWSDIILTTVVIPTMLSVLLKNGESISFSGCISQLYLFGSSAITECFLHTVMSYDRYLAICYPLHYLQVMDFKLQLLLIAGSWIFAFLLTMITVSQMWQLHFCGPNVIDHFLCDPTTLLELSCSDTSVIELENLILGLPVTLLPLGFIIVTYAFILITILKITSSAGRQKAFSTYSSHMAVVCIYYGTLITLYVIPSKGLSVDVTKVQSLLYTVVTPLFNPIIYSLRNKEIKTVIKHIIYIR
ncbi:PREDICTED: olfactory receptor 11A1-like [Nanorana parkeri]|uniref:olfactory receptor 11A1-like n=1 Tax=Nanorana parkeri TaxID=125878 RepID=UPI000854ACBD|nr:PREDICTED: olfactory receptor 11A1-like [Nanorana parkeri]